MFDVIIIGKGPAGLTAAIYTARGRLKTLVLGTGGGSLAKAEKIENYFGFMGIVSGNHLLMQGELQAKSFGAEIVNEEVLSLSYDDEGYKVTTGSGIYSSKAVILATGQPYKKIDIKNIDRFEGKGISYCSTCDGFFYRGKKVGVLGFKDYALHEATELSVFTADITIFTNGEKLQAKIPEKDGKAVFKLNEKVVSAFEGNDYLEKIVFNDNTESEIDGIFMAYGSASSIDFARKLGVMTSGNSIIVNNDMMTNLEGCFSAGDCTGGFRQVSVAAGQGAVAAWKAIEYVRKFGK